MKTAQTIAFLAAAAGVSAHWRNATTITDIVSSTTTVSCSTSTDEPTTTSTNDQTWSVSLPHPISPTTPCPSDEPTTTSTTDTTWTLVPPPPCDSSTTEWTTLTTTQPCSTSIPWLGSAPVGTGTVTFTPPGNGSHTWTRPTISGPTGTGTGTTTGPSAVVTSGAQPARDMRVFVGAAAAVAAIAFSL